MKRASIVAAVSSAVLALGCGAEDEPVAERQAAAVLKAPSVVPSGAAGAKVEPEDRPAAEAKATPKAEAEPADDAEAAQSFPAADPSTLTERPPAPTDLEAAPAASGEEEEKSISEGAPSDEQIARELEQMEQVQKRAKASSGSAGGGGGRLTLNRDGTASAPADAPIAVRRIISAANAIAKYPYVYGGGHGSFTDTAYDCSGSVSYALAAAGLVERPLVSGEFAKMGETGPGKWVTIYANAGHMFMVVGGLRYDTSGRGGPLGSRWQTASRSTKGLSVRHPPGF